MQKATQIIALAAIGLVSAPDAHAGVSQDFAGCDGLKKPKRKNDGMRGVAVIQSYSSLSYRSARSKIGSCDRALSSPKLLPKQALRRAHLLRSRAAAYLSIGEHEKALADIDAADAAISNQANDVFFGRSMGASLTLLRAMAYSDAGKTDEAAKLAEQAASQRPYALQVQMAAAMIRQGARPIGQHSASPWKSLRQLWPQSKEKIVQQEADVGNFEAVAKMADEISVNWPDPPVPAFALAIQKGAGTKFLNALMSSTQIAYAKAVIGDAEAARSEFKIIRANMDSISSGEDQQSRIVKLLKDKFVDPYENMVEARIALSEGRVADARGLIANRKLPTNAAAAELLKSLQEKAGEGSYVEAKKLEGLANQLRENRRKSAGKAADLALIAPESKRSVVDYKKSRPNILSAIVGGALSMGTSLLGGISRTNGFRSKQHEDGTVTVEFVGSTTSGPMVQEMTLLRAAELAQESKKTKFAVVDRKDYQRFSVTKQYGMEISRVPTGYKTELRVRFLDQDNPETGDSFDTVKVIDDLGPYYYDG